MLANREAAPRARIVGRYALFDEIAAGGMATIHLGRLVGPVGFSRTVAIKTLHPQFAKDPEFVEMFLEEARLASRIQHLNVISTVDVATAEGEVFLVMEYIAGESLAKLVRSALKRGERLPIDVAATILAGMLHGLHATHEAKNEQLEPMHVVHRDVSPQNVLVGVDGIARIFDFGVAKAAAMRSQATSDGQMKGKLSYMSPEQLNSREVDRRTDVFAAGVVAWECLTGRRLFAGSDPGEVLAKVLTLDIPAPNTVQDGIPANISATIMRALERSPAQRWQTAREFAIELERNVVLAAPHVVGSWVERNANEALLDRRQRVQAVERASVDLGRGTGADASVPPYAGASVALNSHPPVSELSDFSSAGSGTARSSSLSVTSSRAAPGPSLRRPLGLMLLLGVFGVSLAAGLWYWQYGGFGDLDWDGTPAALPQPVESRSAPALAAPSSPSGAEAAGDGESLPVLEFDSLPEQPDAPDASPAAAQSGRSPRPWATVRRAGKRFRAPAAPVKPAAPAAARAPAPSPPPAPPPQGVADSNSECEPPWYMDAKGIQRLKPMCL